MISHIAHRKDKNIPAMIKYHLLEIQKHRDIIEKIELYLILLYTAHWSDTTCHILLHSTQ